MPLASTARGIADERKGKRGKMLGGIEDNPFESRGILNKKHDVFNRRVKGEKRNVARARGQATRRREKTLLVDYQRSQKANTFRDRRCVIRPCQNGLNCHGCLNKPGISNT